MSGTFGRVRDRGRALGRCVWQRWRGWRWRLWDAFWEDALGGAARWMRRRASWRGGSSRLAGFSRLARFSFRGGEAASLGRRGERAAERFLRGLGYLIVRRGEQERGGELDLIAVDGRTIVYVEVKTRRAAREGESSDAGRPADAVDRRKRLRISRAAAEFSRRHRLDAYPARFDIVEVLWAADGGRPRVTHLTAAFESELPD